MGLFNNSLRMNIIEASKRTQLLFLINSQSLEDTQVGTFCKNTLWINTYRKSIHCKKYILRKNWDKDGSLLKCVLKVRGEARKYDGRTTTVILRTFGCWTLGHVTQLHFGYRTCLIWPWCAKMVKVWLLSLDFSQRLSCGAQLLSRTDVGRC